MKEGVYICSLLAVRINISNQYTIIYSKQFDDNKSAMWDCR